MIRKPDTRGGLDRRDAARYLGISMRSLDYLAARGQIRRVRIGRKPIYPVVELDRYLVTNLITSKSRHTDTVR